MVIHYNYPVLTSLKAPKEIGGLKYMGCVQQRLVSSSLELASSPDMDWKSGKCSTIEPNP